MKEYRVSFLVEADSPADAVERVCERLNAGGDPDSVEVTHVSEPSN